MLESRGFLLILNIISPVFETFSGMLLAVSQFVRCFRSIFKSLFNLFSDLLMIIDLCHHQNGELCNVSLIHEDH